MGMYGWYTDENGHVMVMVLLDVRLHSTAVLGCLPLDYSEIFPRVPAGAFTPFIGCLCPDCWNVVESVDWSMFPENLPRQTCEDLDLFLEKNILLWELINMFVKRFHHAVANRFYHQPSIIILFHSTLTGIKELWRAELCPGLRFSKRGK